jgi:hypothetical protein
MLMHNPGVSVLWTTTEFHGVRFNNDLVFRMGEPLAMSWWAEGRAATREEVDAAIARGLPGLLEQADDDQDRADIHKSVAKLHARLDQQFRQEGVTP